ncbi:cytochrome c oxidase assembly protein [Cryobacterium sp. M91]|uniref:cytochrome c oxidase assembly protein n=1 Tax=Cryobacterium sp. M91 TaxID=2048294 RepID=UPI000CE4BA70|nr:cytochrome c oxidase assembly protein [Cryobacterium sp. M91]
MSDTHEAHAGHAATALETAVPLILIAAVALGYVLLAHNRGKEPRGWSSWRIASFLTGCTLLALGLSPQTSPFPLGGLPTHMYQHLLIGMYAPIGLVLGAPITLLLRSVPRSQGKLMPGQHFPAGVEIKLGVMRFVRLFPWQSAWAGRDNCRSAQLRPWFRRRAAQC